MNGKARLKLWSLAVVALIWVGIWGYSGNLKLNMKKTLELGTKGEPFFVLSSICEDDEENIYILDKKRFNVRKFSKDGRELLSFGSKGEGPTSFLTLNKVYFSKKTGIIVTEMMNFASIFTTNGKIIKKINFTKKGGLLFYIKYIGEDIFYGVSQRGVPKPQQILMDSTGNIVNSNLYASDEGEVNMPDGMSYSSYLSTDVSPRLVFESYNGYGIAGLSNKYELKLLNSQGKTIRIIRRNIEGLRLTEKERDYFTKMVRNEKDLPPTVQNKFVNLIPKNKMYFYTAMPTTKYVFVFRIKEDTTNEKPPYPVDVFLITGEYVGVVNVHKIPILVSDKNMYFEEGDENNEDSPILLVKYSYEVIK